MKITDPPVKQPIMGGTNTLLATNGTSQYFTVMGISAIATNKVNISQPLPMNGVVFNAYVYLPTAPGAGKSRTFTLEKNGSATAIAITINDTDTTGEDTDSVTVVKGDLLVWHSDGGVGVPAQTRAYIGLVFQ